MHVARPTDWIVILGCLLTLIALYGSAGFLLIRPFIAPKEIVPKLGITGYFVLAVAAMGLALMAYALFVEPYDLEVTHVALKIKGLPASGPPIRIVQISDLHCDTQIRLESKLPAVIADLKPDLIFFTGDAVNALDALPVFNDCIHKIMAIAPTFAVMGDWDFAFPGVAVLRNAGLKVLNQAIVVDVRGTKLCLVGTDSGAKTSAVLMTAPKGLPTIVLFHNPDADIILNNQTAGVDLYLCGHTHGGQIALPYYGALITQSVQGKKYESGLHRLGDMWIYITRGIGMEGHFPRMRFCAKPEVVVFDLTGVDKP